MLVFFCKEKTAYESRISDWTSDVCSSDLLEPVAASLHEHDQAERELAETRAMLGDPELREMAVDDMRRLEQRLLDLDAELQLLMLPKDPRDDASQIGRASCRERVCQYV